VRQFFLSKCNETHVILDFKGHEAVALRVRVRINQVYTNENDNEKCL